MNCKPISTFCFFMTLATAVAAQTPPPKVDPVPPKAEKLEEVSEVKTDKDLNIGKPQPKEKITEKRNNLGQVTEVEVKSGASQYKVKPHSEVGNVAPGSLQSDQNRAPQWTILEFGIKKPATVDNAPPANEKSKPASTEKSK